MNSLISLHRIHTYRPYWILPLIVFLMRDPQIFDWPAQYCKRSFVQCCLRFGKSYLINWYRVSAVMNSKTSRPIYVGSIGSWPRTSPQPWSRLFALCMFSSLGMRPNTGHVVCPNVKIAVTEWISIKKRNKKDEGVTWNVVWFEAMRLRLNFCRFSFFFICCNAKINSHESNYN